MTTSVGTVSGMPANGASGVSPATPLTATATVADTVTGLAYLEVQIATDAGFTNIIADVTSLDVVAASPTNRSVTIPLSGVTRDAGWQPFGQPGSSVWNTAIGTTATYSTAVDARVTEFSADAGSTVTASYPIFFANATDATTVVAVSGVARSYQIPATAAPSADATHGLVVVAPDHTLAYETTGTVVGGGITLISGNLFDLNTQDLETTIGTWVANHFTGDAACTVARSNTTAYNGTWSLALTATAAGAAAQTGTVTVTGATAYTTILRIKGPIGRHVTVNFQWNGSGGFISNSSSGLLTLTGGFDQVGLFTQAAPNAGGVGTATNASVYVFAQDSASGDVYNIDLAYMGTNASPTFGGAGWTATKWAQVDLTGSTGVLGSGNGGGFDGVRNCGASVMAGMLRETERSFGSFPHALAIGMSLAQLATTAVWPAVTDPALAATGGTGTIPGNLLDANTEDLEATIGTWIVNTNCTIARDATHASFGTESLKVTATAAGAIPQTGSVATVNATSYTAIAQVFAPVGITVLVGIQEKLTGTFVGNTFGGTVTGNGMFQQISLTITTGATGGGASNQSSVFLDATNSVAGTIFWVDSTYIGTNATPGGPTGMTGGATGQNPLGELVAIPQTVTLSGLGLTANGLLVATALQKYGGYVVATEAGFRLYAESTINATFLANLNTDLHLLTAQLRVVTNRAASLAALSAAGSQGGGTALVAAPAVLAQSVSIPPTNLTVPVITGTPSAGSVLTGSSGTWTGGPTFAYQWRLDRVNIAGATTTSYTPVTANAGHTLDFLVTATNVNGSSQADSVPATVSSGGAVLGGVAKLISDMVDPATVHGHGIPTNYSFYPGPELDTTLPPASFTANTAWGVIWFDAAQTTTSTNTRVEITDQALWLWSNNAGKWQLNQTSTGVGVTGAHYFEPNPDGSPFNNGSTGASMRSENDGTGGVSDLMTLSSGQTGPGTQNGIWFHFWPNTGRGSMPNAADVGGAVTWFRARLILDNPNGTDDRANCHLVAAAGSDWWQSATAPWPDNSQIYYARYTAIPTDGSWVWFTGNSWTRSATWASQGGDSGARITGNTPPFPG